jgi:hypothetical protein
VDEPQWSVALPEGAEPPFQVWVNGEPRDEGTHYRVEGRWLRFRTPLQPKMRAKGLGRRLMLLAGIGVYGDQKADVVDLRYHAGGRVQHATDLPILPPDAGRPPGAEPEPG